MDKLLALVAALNAVQGEITLCDEGIKFVEKDTEGKVTNHLFIKLRPVADEDGIEEMKYVARKQ